MNKVLLIGLIFTGFFLIIALTGPLIAPFPVDYDEKIRSVEDESPGEYEVLVAPHPPGPRHLFGTDPWGYDLLTLMLYGARFTVFLSISIALLRISFSVLIALYSPIEHEERKQRNYPSPFAGIPVFLPVYFFFYNVFLNPPVSIFVYTLLQSALMCLLGIPAVYPLLREKIRITASLPFITAARSMGAGRFRIIRRHIIPQLYPSLLLLLSQETISILCLFGTLGIFNMFIGGTRYSNQPALFHSMSHEWAGLLGQYRSYIMKPHEWWLIFFPLFGYLAVLLSFYILSKGITRYVSTRQHVH